MLQMVAGLTPSVAGLFMVPMVAGIGTTSFTSGHLMSRTGRYAWMPVAGAAGLRERVAGAYHDALIPVFGVLAPLMLGAALLLMFVREHPADAAPLAEAAPVPVTGDLAPQGGEP